MRVRGSWIAWIAGALVAAPATAGEGAIEISQACAAVTGCLPGDFAGFPVRIGSPGSYRLTGDLVVPNENTTAIWIDAFGVTLDLGGHTLRGPGTCSGTPTTCSLTSGTGRGVYAPDSTSGGSPRVRNGRVIGMGEHGLFLGSGSSVEDLIVSENRLDGIGCVGLGCLIARCTASLNGGSGIAVGDAATVADNVARANGAAGIRQVFSGAGSTFTGNATNRNGADGIDAGRGATLHGNSAGDNGEDGISTPCCSGVTGNTARSNAGDGIECGTNCAVQRNALVDNAGFGLRLGADSAYRANVVYGNDSGGVTGAGAVNRGDNLCSGPNVISLACP